MRTNGKAGGDWIAPPARRYWRWLRLEYGPGHRRVRECRPAAAIARVKARRATPSAKTARDERLPGSGARVVVPASRLGAGPGSGRRRPRNRAHERDEPIVGVVRPIGRPLVQVDVPRAGRESKQRGTAAFRPFHDTDAPHTPTRVAKASNEPVVGRRSTGRSWQRRERRRSGLRSGCRGGRVGTSIGAGARVAR